MCMGVGSYIDRRWCQLSERLAASSIRHQSTVRKPTSTDHNYLCQGYTDDSLDGAFHAFAHCRLPMLLMLRQVALAVEPGQSTVDSGFQQSTQLIKHETWLQVFLYPRALNQASVLATDKYKRLTTTNNCRTLPGECSFTNG